MQKKGFLFAVVMPVCHVFSVAQLWHCTAKWRREAHWDKLCCTRKRSSPLEQGGPGRHCVTALLWPRSTQVHPPWVHCKLPIRPNEGSAQAAKEGETIANAQYSTLPLPREGCSYCVVFNITKSIQWPASRGPSQLGPLDIVASTFIMVVWTGKLKQGLLCKHYPNKLIYRFFEARVQWHSCGSVCVRILNNNKKNRLTSPMEAGSVSLSFLPPRISYMVYSCFHTTPMEFVVESATELWNQEDSLKN